MKIPLLCCLLVLCLSRISPAQQPPQPANDQAALQNSPAGGDYFGFKLRPDRAVPEPTEYCAYIRAYRVRREYRDSDVVTPAGYTTCVPAKRFELKSAVQVEAKPAPPE